MTRIRNRHISTRTIVRAAMVIKDVPPRLTQTRVPFEQHEAAKYSRGTKEAGICKGQLIIFVQFHRWNAYRLAANTEGGTARKGAHVREKEGFYT